MSKIDIDICPSKRPQVFEMLKEEFGRDRCLNIITFKTETLKSAIKTACRGLGIDGDAAQEMSNLVPISRGRVWSLNEVLHGNSDNGFAPIHALVSKLQQYDSLLETVQEIEELISGRGSHASGFYIFDKPFIEMNSLMKAPSGMDTTCWEMEDSDLAGALKFDILVTDAVEKIQKSMELLLDDKLIQWQGSLKDTYDMYFHPDKLQYTDPQMWDAVGQGSIIDLFQFMSDVGIEAIRKIKPRSLKELAVTSSIMRLMGDEESPIDRYVSFKANINLWYKEMKEAGLNDAEIAVLRKYLDANCGCSVEQEDVMELSMDEHIAGFDMGQADTLRKIIGKKKIEKLAGIKKLFFDEGIKHNTRKIMLDYTWNKCFLPQLGYAFNRPHVLAYAVVALQEMNLYTYFPHIYWQCAVLSINAAANEDDEASKTANYGKIAKAIGDMTHKGVKMSLPNVNIAKFGFSPDTTTDSIVFGLKAINGVGDDAAFQITQRRPYSSISDFYTKNSNLSTKTMISLIKAGALDALGKDIIGDRQRIMADYVYRVAEASCPAKHSLNMQNYKSIKSLNIIPDDFKFIKELVDFKAYAFSKQFMVDKQRYRSDFSTRMYFDNILFKFFTEGVEYYYEGDELFFIKKGFDKFYETQIAPLKEWLAKPETVELYNESSVRQFANDLWTKYCLGTIPHWEMESLSFYYTDHELAGMNTEYYNISNFSDIPSEPIVVGVQMRKGKTWDKYKLYRIAGTVLDKDKNHHTITLLTTSGVVTVKFYAEAFANYDKRISTINKDGEKEILDESWLSRGNMLIITGIRRGDNFFPKKYADSIYQHTVSLITEVYQNGLLNIQVERLNQ